MNYAQSGYELEIDLTTGNIERTSTDASLVETHLGGLGVNAKILWDRVGPEVDPFSPDNLLIFGPGLLCGTPAIGANRTIISSISPQNNLMAFSMMGGFWAPELKYAGYDRLIIRGKSPDLVYLWIQNGKVEIRDARHLKGKSTYETIQLIREELAEPRAQVLSIGLAGENRVYFASIETDKSSASRLGLGAVMGSKNLKAIAVRGTQDILIARPQQFMALCEEVLQFIKHRFEHPIRGVMAIHARIGSPQEMAIDDEKWHTTNFAWGNARHRRKDFWNEEIAVKWTEAMKRARKRLISCYNCPVKCSGIIKLPGFPSYVMKCFSKLTYVFAAMVDDLEFGFKIASRAQHYGMDGYSTPQVIAFALELYEAGILTDRDMEGIPPDTESRFFWLLDRIANREGIGDILANGVYWAARQIGRGAEKYDHNTIKKHEQIPIKLGKLNPIYFLMWSTGEKANITQMEGQIPQGPLPKEFREEFISDWIQIPSGKEDKFKRFILEWGDPGTSFPYYPSMDVICELVEWQETMHYIDDSLGLCAGLSSFGYKPPYHIHNLPSFISYATGKEITEEGLWEIAKRNRNLVRANNIRRGLSRRDEKPPEDHWKKRFPDYEARLLDEYYKFQGWNKEGIPTKETLEKLDLGYVYEDLLERGLIGRE